MTDFAPLFAEYETKRPRLRQWLRTHYIKEFGLQPGRLLDMGCGNGFWASLFVDEGFTVEAFDTDQALIADGRTRYPAVSFKVADVEKPLPYGAPFDVVFIRTIPQLYAKTLTKTVAVIRNGLNSLGPGGTFLLSAYTDGSGEDRSRNAGGTARHHPPEAYAEAVRRAGAEVHHAARIGNYLQLSVRL